MEKEKKKLKLVMKSKRYADHVRKIQESRKAVAELLQHSLKVEARTRGNRTNPDTRKLPDLDFSIMQRCAARVYDIIRCGLKCSCRSSHGINLQLEHRNRSIPPPSNGADHEPYPSFRVVFSYTTCEPPPEIPPWKIEAVEIFPGLDEAEKELHSHSILPTKPLAKPIVRFLEPGIEKVTKEKEVLPAPEPFDSICLATSNTCLGGAFQGSRVIFLRGELLKQKFGVIQPKSTCRASSDPSLVPLRKALSLSNAAEYRRRLSNLVRLRLSVVLAWGLLQLHHTPWCNDSWGHTDINLLDIPGHSFLDRPFINRQVSPEAVQHSSIPSHFSSSQPRNRPLFALGVLLTELCLGEPFDKLREQQLHILGMPETSSDLDVADSLIDDVYNQAGDTYGDAVRKCIRCEFDCRRNTLDDEEFRKAVYKNVIVMLEQNLETFQGGGKWDVI